MFVKMKTDVGFFYDSFSTHEHSLIPDTGLFISLNFYVFISSYYYIIELSLQQPLGDMSLGWVESVIFMTFPVFNLFDLYLFFFQ